MSSWLLVTPILVPALGGLLVFLTPRSRQLWSRLVALLFSAAGLGLTILLFGQELSFSWRWLGFGIDFALKLYSFSSLILLVAAFTFLAVLYSGFFMRDRPRQRQFFGFVLLTSALVTGAMLANNLVLMLFFWESLLATLFALVLTGGEAATPAAIKALILNGVGDLCLILGVALVAGLAGTLQTDQISLPLTSYSSGAAWLLMMIGAITKAGSMPLHTWIPDAATTAPLPVMALLPGSLDKILGIYLLARLNLDLFQLQPGSFWSLLLLIIGSVTILGAVMMALIQKDYKRLLSYHAISQVGYMILGIGTALPIGIVGGIFHMINNALYKSCLFYTAGAVEEATGSTDLRQLGGLARRMPVTCVSFLIAALAISGVPPLNGFFSKELIFDAALETNWIWLAVAVLGAFFTAASFLKLAHAVYFGQPSPQSAPAKEAHWSMLLPMVVLAAVCVLFGVYNPLPLQGLIEPILGGRLTESLAGLPANWWLVGLSILVLLAAVGNHFFGVRKSGKSWGASDHFHYAWGLRSVYDWAEAGYLDLYNIGARLGTGLAISLYAVDRSIDWFWSRLIPAVASWLGRSLKRSHIGEHWLYIFWILAGAAAVALIFLYWGG